MKNLVCFICLFLFGLWGGGFILFADKINAYEENYSLKADAIVALTGGRNRIAKAVEILNKNKADVLFVSGVDEFSSWESIKKKQNIKTSNNEKVVLGKKAKNTLENAKEALDWIHKNKITSIYLVTSNYHLARSVSEFRALDKDLIIIPFPVYSEKVQKKWWKSWRTFSLIFKEYNKFLCVCVRCYLNK
ncbi:MAG: YdcF family protein [Alphaproteobacteria bacterium]|nr:YdcF family protein [Alphaproteobacteria bacterium]